MAVKTVSRSGAIRSPLGRYSIVASKPARITSKSRRFTAAYVWSTRRASRNRRSRERLGSAMTWVVRRRSTTRKRTHTRSSRFRRRPEFASGGSTIRGARNISILSPDIAMQYLVHTLARDGGCRTNQSENRAVNCRGPTVVGCAGPATSVGRGGQRERNSALLSHRCARSRYSHLCATASTTSERDVHRADHARFSKARESTSRTSSPRDACCSSVLTRSRRRVCRRACFTGDQHLRRELTACSDRQARRSSFPSTPREASRSCASAARASSKRPAMRASKRPAATASRMVASARARSAPVRR